jgi:hypothetical protein
MKIAFKKKGIVTTLIFAFGIISCDKDDNTLPILSGTYTESSPVSGRSQMIFSGKDKVIIKESFQNGKNDEFTYRITTNAIMLTPAWDDSPGTELELEIISNNEFVIENLYPSIPENPKSYMAFKK